MVSNCIPQYSAGYKYLSKLEILTFGTKVLICHCLFWSNISLFVDGLNRPKLFIVGVVRYDWCIESYMHHPLNSHDSWVSKMVIINMRQTAVNSSRYEHHIGTITLMIFRYVKPSPDGKSGTEEISLTVMLSIMMRNDAKMLSYRTCKPPVYNDRMPWNALWFTATFRW